MALLRCWCFQAGLRAGIWHPRVSATSQPQDPQHPGVPGSPSSAAFRVAPSSSFFPACPFPSQAACHRLGALCSLPGAPRASSSLPCAPAAAWATSLLGPRGPGYKSAWPSPLPSFLRVGAAVLCGGPQWPDRCLSRISVGPSGCAHLLFGTDRGTVPGPRGAVQALRFLWPRPSLLGTSVPVPVGARPGEEELGGPWR